MSYCRITGKAKGLPKPNYFPLLPPISPADARRFCRITGKAYGLPTHCYIPVILTQFSNRSKCKITNSVEPHHYEPDYEYGKRKHTILTDYRYMIPVLDATNAQQKHLIDILNSKVVQCDEHYFIYTIKEQKCNLMFPAKFEAAVRDGDLRDVMFAKINDSVLLCMNKGKSVSLDLQDYVDVDSEKQHLFEGEGPKYEVLLARETEQNASLPSQRNKRKKNGLRKAKTFDESLVLSNDKINGISTENSIQNEHTNCNNGFKSDSDSSQMIENGVTDSNNVNGTIKPSRWNFALNDAELGESIPNSSEIFKIMQNYSKGTVVQNESSISGLSINIGTDEMPRNVLILGSIVKTGDGDVFVAGRTVSTQNGSIFEPGIYVQSKAGPTFIPGQIIYTEEEGERFVPGQIIDTEFGPRFVPGKISDIDGEVTFTPAQIVQTDQGPKFIASDLCDDENGERKYSVQSFLLSPEEMTLLKPMHMWTKAFPSSSSSSSSTDQTTTMDMNMFNQLTEAGIIIGSHIEVSDENVEVLLQKAINEQIFRKFAENSGFNDAPTIVLDNIFNNVKMLINLVQKNPQKFFLTDTTMINGNEIISGDIMTKTDEQNSVDTWLMEIIAKTVVDCVYFETNGRPPSHHGTVQFDAFDPVVYEIISESLIKHLKHDDAECKLINISVDTIEKLFTSPETMLQIENNVKSLAAQRMRTNKVDTIKAMINQHKINDTDDANETTLLENLQNCMQNETINELFESVRNLICHESTLMGKIIREIQQQAEHIVNETQMIEILRKCIVAAIQNSTNDDIKQMNATRTPAMNNDDDALSTYLTDTISLARALGFTDCILNLSNIINSHHHHDDDDGDMIAQLKTDEKSFELLQRIIVMHKLSKDDGEREKSMNLLRHDPYSARSDIILRELIRCSGICTINTLEGNLEDSNDVPLSLIYSGNQLAIEDFLIRKQSKPHGPILIVKDRFQAVVPREASRNVLTGKCAYTVLDENGIRHFEPLHMFTALKLKNVTMFEDRFSTYSALAGNNNNNANEKKIKTKCDIDRILNMSAMATASSNGCIAYKSTNHKFSEPCYRRRSHSSTNGLLFVKSQVKYRPFYL